MPPKKVYEKVDPITHILLRPDMYIGSNRKRKELEHVAHKNSDDLFKIVKKDIEYTPGLCRIFIEVLSNAIDNVERSRKEKIACTSIKININKETGETSVWNDGDIIPIEINEKEKIYNHSLIFGHLLAGSNFEKEQERLISGRNGLGSKCAARGTKVPCFDGSIKKVEDIKVGDILIGDDGKKREVLHKITGSGEMYKVSQSRGDSYTVNSEHILSLRMPDHKVIFWSTEKQGWQMVYLDAKNQKIHSKSVRALPSPGIECPECGIILSSNLNRHYRRMHKDKEIPKMERRNPTVNPPKDCEEVRNAYIEMQKFAKSITDDNTIDISIQDYLKAHNTFKSRLSGFKSECVQWEKKEVYLDPYVLGLWLGDGFQPGKGFSINAEDDYEIFEYLKNWGQKNDANFTHLPRCKNCKENKYDPNFIPCKSCASFSINSIEYKWKKNKSPLRNLLKKYDLLKEKFIPIEYKVNDRDTRLKVLAGLIDSDGHVSKERQGRRIVISQGMMHEKLADDILYLARTLGFSASKNIRDVTWTYENEKRTGQCIIINISGNGLEDIPTLLPRKKCSPPLSHEVLNTGPIKIEKVENGKFVGLTIDGNERFVINDFTVTHNCTNVFSKKFIVKGLDPDSGKTFEQTWTNNMRDTTESIVKNTKLKKGYTHITYFPDFEKFECKGYDNDTISLYTKYILDAAMLTKVKVYLNDELINVSNIQDYCSLYNENPVEECILIKNSHSEVIVTPSTGEFEAISFVNGIYTKIGGVHVDAFAEAIFRPLVEKFNKKKGKPSVNIKDVKQFFRLFIVSTIPNPEFSSQEKLKLESPKIEAIVKTSDINKILKWSVISDIEDIIKAKEMVVLKKTSKKSKSYTKIDGYDPANFAGTKQSHECSLILCEGLSAKTYAVAGIQKGINNVAGRNYYGILALSGKCLNVRNSNPTTISKNKVITNLIQALGIQYDVDYTNEENYRTLNYGAVILLTDSDCFADDTSLIIKKNNTVSIVSIDSLYDQNLNIDSQIVNDTEVWDDKGWVKIKAIRKKVTDKKILTINTYSGIVRCTENHKFILENGEEIKACDIKLGDRLLRNRRIQSLPKFNLNTKSADLDNIRKKLQCFNSSKAYSKKDIIESINNELKFCTPYNLSDYYNGYKISEEEAWVWGFFFADGSCGIYTFTKDRKKTTEKNTMVSRKRWQNKVLYHTNNIEILNKELLHAKKNNLNCVKINKKILESSKRLETSKKNCERVSKEIKTELLRTGYSYHLDNCDKSKIEKSYDIMRKFYPEFNWTIVKLKYDSTSNRQQPYRLILNGGKEVEKFIECMRNRFYNHNKLKKVPDEILNNTINIQQSFYDGYYAGDGFRWLKKNKNSEGFDILGQVGAQGLCYIVENLGYSVNIKEKKGKKNVFTISISKRYRRFYPGEVKNIYETEYKDRFVYDIETESGKINGGIGNMIQRQCDGLHISGLIMNFFHSLFPSVFKRDKPFLVSMLTPIVRVFNKGGDRLFYDENNFRQFEKTQSKKINCKYYKGLGTTKAEDVQDTFGLKMLNYSEDENTIDMMNKVFHKNSSDERKKWLENYDPSPKFSLDNEGVSIDMKLSTYLDTELIKFSVNDCKRSIPCLFDGLKESQRKILFGFKKRNLTFSKPSVKVAQLGGYIAEHTSYHHGEQNLLSTIINMAQDYVGSNNIPYFYRDGMFGTRLENGQDAASPRYIFTKMEKLTPLIFRQEDDVLLDYIVEEGDSIEPKFYIPIIPTILINGTVGIGTGWSSTIPCYNPLDIIGAVKVWIENDGEVILQDPDDDSVISLLPELKPWYRGFNGTIEQQSEDKYITKGIITPDVKNSFKISELPIGMSTNKFKESIEDLLVNKSLKKIQNYSTPTVVNFTIQPVEGFKCNIDNLKMYTYINTSNMVLFNEKDQLRKYTIDQIINEFCKVRYEYYEKRKKYIINALEKELLFLSNKERFIREVINEILIIKNIDKSVVVKNMEKSGYHKNNLEEDSGEADNTTITCYDYLLKMEMQSMTMNKINQIKKDISVCEEKIKEARSKSENKMWLDDLEEFEKEYVKWLSDMEKNSKKSTTSKKVKN